MKVGDYVRTKQGIEKIKVVEENFTGDENCIFYATDNKEWNGAYNGKYNGFTNRNRTIIKSSPNILELLEEHDFITIEYYSLRYDERVERIFEVDYKDNEFTTLKNAYCGFMLKNNEFNDNDKALEPIIKSIVTKEQFSQMEYRIGE